MSGTPPRIPRMSISIFGINYIHRRSPWAAAWWSAALPGFGHFYLGSYMKGFALMVWEIIVNLQSNLNLAILYTFTGDFHQACQVVDYDYLLFYPAIYIFGIWDSYRLAIQNNRLAEMEEGQKSRFYQRISLGPGGNNFLDKRTPWVAALWAAIFGGAGHLYNHQTLKALILMSWYLVVTIKGNITTAAMYTFTGNFAKATEVLNYEWLLFWPTIFMFNIWDSYVEALEINKLHKEELMQYWSNICIPRGRI